jgi:TPR repeat protein
MKSFIRSLLLALALTAGVWVPVQAQTFEQSLAAYARKDYRTAFAGYKKLAEQGHADAQYILGGLYADGRGGVPNDDQQAVVWYRKSAEQGFTMAQYDLGEMYNKGRGVPKDEELAYFWWLLSSAQGHDAAVKNRDIVGQRLTPQQRANAQAAARVWKPK